MRPRSREKTKAIIPVHLYGQWADMDPILAIAKRHGLIVIEDAAQAHGAEYKGRRAGSMGDMGCFSFYPGKNLGAYGEGGMVVTDNPEYTRTIRMLRDWGAEKKYHHVLKGYNFRLEGIQGAVLRVKLRLPRGLDRSAPSRRRALRQAARGQRRADAEGNAATPATSITSTRSAPRIGRPGRRRCWRKASRRGIHYPIPVHLLPAYADLGYRAGQFPALRAGGKRGAVAADVPGVDGRADRGSQPRGV